LAKIAVVGGGVCGLSAALHLAEQHRVTLFEKTPRLGGRAVSFSSHKLGCEIDTGMHIAIGAYRHFWALIEQLGSQKHWQTEPLRITYQWPYPNRQTRLLRSLPLPGALHLLPSVWQNSMLKWNDIRALYILLYGHSKAPNVAALLSKMSVSQQSIRLFWRPIVISSMNCEPEKAAPAFLRTILKRGFFAGSAAARIAIPIRPFREIFDQPGQALLLKKNVELRLQTSVHSWKRVNNRIRLHGSEYDAVLLALPRHALASLFPGIVTSDKHTPIVSYYLRSSHQLTNRRMIFLVDSPLQWLFRVAHEENLYTLTLSDSQLDWHKAQIEQELHRYLPGSWRITALQRVNMRRATPLQDTAYVEERKQVNKGVERIFFAGDWSDPELPATFEAAAAQGAEAAKTINQQFI
jgi:predicted NAD/FAD-binding protein